MTHAHMHITGKIRSNISRGPIHIVLRSEMNENAHLSRDDHSETMIKGSPPPLPNLSTTALSVNNPTICTNEALYQGSC